MKIHLSEPVPSRCMLRQSKNDPSVWRGDFTEPIRYSALSQQNNEEAPKLFRSYCYLTQIHQNQKQGNGFSPCGAQLRHAQEFQQIPVVVSAWTAVIKSLKRGKRVYRRTRESGFLPSQVSGGWWCWEPTQWSLCGCTHEAGFSGHFYSVVADGHKGKGTEGGWKCPARR